MKVTIYSDVVCPWCYIGLRRFARALSAFPESSRIEAVFRPYQLDPAAPTTAVPLPEYLEHRFGKRVDDMLGRVSSEAQREGIAIAWDRALSANTRTAHRLLELAEREYGGAVQRALAERLFDLYFTRGGNIADAAQLADAAASVGMARDRVCTYLESDEGLPQLDAAFDEARRLGIRAVPTFVINDRYVIQGAQSAATLLDVLREAARTEMPVPS